ncbi:hypothetical protein AU255_18100 [Methyloprofundus sedimenti]|uniref:Glycosyl transferase family 25 domain-containing protein n=1 Tax=Methyloprofundus sedimenti TaxID=1420851 RepID=A0A1V8M1T3_9GAMM|nr:glycosyltransferase family 25 protein [Methyloprofundus sedimenti]OQK15383.1 hypothetical protein AU255_18100 [Methyloprofundus sedimenti]
MNNQTIQTKVLIISLKRATERREHIVRQMQEQNIPFEFFDAVDGRTLTEEQKSKADLELAEKLLGHTLVPGEIGCALSHIGIYEKMVQENIPSCIILEDDMIFDPQFKNIIQKIETLKNDWELIYLLHGKAKSWPLKRTLAPGFKLARYRFPSKNSKRTIIFTVGYMLTLVGAKKMLKVAYPIRMPSDYLLGCIQTNRLKTYGVEPSCMQTDIFQTTIQDRNYGPHETGG